jgi:hypothetical protein
MTTRGQPCPERRRRVASLYQDKEVRQKSKIIEEDTFKDSVVELLDIYNNDRRGETSGASYGEFTSQISSS